MTTPLFQVDSFTTVPFTGNPAGVALLDAPAEPAWMLAVAAEVDVAETAFLVGRDAGAYDLRWFSPTVEIDLCGHATLASAHVLFTEYKWPSDRIEFLSKSGPLSVARD